MNNETTSLIQKGSKKSKIRNIERVGQIEDREDDRFKNKYISN